MQQSNNKTMDRPSQKIMFYERCRLCLDEKGYCDIFEKNNLKEDILDCLGLKIALLDNLPQKICEKCLNIVNNAKELRHIALKNDNQLKLLLFNGEESEISDKVENLDSTQSHPAIRTFLRVRKDLFESSVPGDISDDDMAEVDSSQIDTSQVDSSQDPDKKLNKFQNDENLEYKCDKCNKIFDKKKKLYLHSRLHNKNFLCPVHHCDKKFATKGDLEKHIRTHTGEKPFKCDQCSRSFTQKVSLKSHLETVHTDEVLF